MFPDFVDDVVDDGDYYFVVSIGNRGLSQTGKSELGTFVREKGEEPMMEFSFLFECCVRKLYPCEITRNFGPLGLRNSVKAAQTPSAQYSLYLLDGLHL